MQKVITDSVLAHGICCTDETFSGDVKESVRKYGSLSRREDAQTKDTDLEITRCGWLMKPWHLVRCSGRDHRVKNKKGLAGGREKDNLWN